MKLHMNLGKNSYDILMQRGCILEISKYIDVNRKVMILTDDGVPYKNGITLHVLYIYKKTVIAHCLKTLLHCFIPISNSFA